MLGDFRNANFKCLHVNKTATSYREKMEICCIIENLASIKTRIHRKTIEGLHDIFRFFCFKLGKNLSLSNRDTYLRDPLFSNLLHNHRKSPAHFHGVVLTEISGRVISILNQRQPIGN